MNTQTWTSAKVVHLKLSREKRWSEGQKYLPLHRKIERAWNAFWTAVGIAVITNGQEQI